MITIKLLTKENSSDYRKARLECLFHFSDHFGTSYEEEISKPELFFEKLIREENQDHFMFGAFDGKECIGLCGFFKGTGTKIQHKGELVQMYVHPNYQGRGIAKNLVQHIIEKAKNNPLIEQIMLAVVASNTKAIGLYLQSGFTTYAIMKDYFKIDGNYYDQLYMIYQSKNT